MTRIDGKPVVKVIDFGLAKAAGPRNLTDKSVYTHFMKFMGTPAYMSPEQVGLSGVDIDTRSDIYSLGILLYELLTGHTPLNKKDLVNESYDVLRKRIREIDAPKPSHRVSTLANADRTTAAAKRRVEPGTLVRQLRGDLDWIVLKALEKQRDRRYSSAAGFAEDIDRYLNKEPVSAAAPSPWYTIGKYAARHRWVIATTASFVAVLLLGTIVSTLFAVSANNNAQLLEENAGALTKALALAKEQENLAKDEATRANVAAKKATELKLAIQTAYEEQRDVNYIHKMVIVQKEMEDQNFREAEMLLRETDPRRRGFEWYY